jgi:predicted negative regulator of RcsB-dependent stress response
MPSQDHQGDRQLIALVVLLWLGWQCWQHTQATAKTLKSSQDAFTHAMGLDAPEERQAQLADYVAYAGTPM